MTPHFTPDAPKPTNPLIEHKKMNDLTTYLMDRRRALLAELASIERILGLQKKTVDKR